uniref:Uncharacterized protein n=1 Tax=viral metagenome TaxID=1070528 RepID=A0A6M3LSA5_9ZZZZ
MTRSDQLQKMTDLVAVLHPTWKVEGFGGDRCDNVVIATDVEGDWTEETYTAEDLGLEVTR